MEPTSICQVDLQPVQTSSRPLQEEAGAPHFFHFCSPAGLAQVLGCRHVWEAMRPLFLLIATLLATGVVHAIDPGIPQKAIVVAPLKGEVSEAQFLILRRALKSAEAQKASAFVLDMDTYGGSLSAAVKILDLLLKSKVPTYTWVNTNAGSAGALIALGTTHIYMAPVSAIGAAAPVMGGGQEPPETMSSKIISYYSGYFRSAAEKNGYNPELAEAFINKDKEVKIGKKVINPKGNLLTLSAQEAVKKHGGKNLLASGIADNITQLVDDAGLGEHPVYRFEPSGFEQVAKWITTLAPLFLIGGIIGAYMEFKTPGFGVPGLVSALCFILFFTGHYIAGLTGYEAAALFVAGMLLVFFELLFFPGIFFIAATGLLFMFAGLLFAMVDYWPSRPFTVDFATLGMPLINFAISVLIATVAIGLLARFLPSIPLFRMFFLGAHSPAGPSFPIMETSVVSGTLACGDTGMAVSVLRPSGKATFGAMVADVTTSGEFLEAGTKVRVEKLEGGQAIVAAVPS